MMSIFNLGASPKVTPAGTQSTEAGQAQGQGALSSFGALLAQVVAGDGEAAEGLDGKLSQLAAMLGKFRAEAEDSLSEVFPDGVIVPGPQFDGWARDMLTKLDGMLADAGLSLTQVTQALGSLDTLVEGLFGAQAGGGEAASMLAQAARTLLGDAAGAGTTQGGTLAEVAEAIKSLDLTEGAGLPEGLELPEAPELRAMMAELAKGQGGAEAATKANVTAPSATEAALASDATDPTPLPDALKLLLAQVVAAPADRALPADMQTLLNAPQPAAAPLIATVAATAPAQAPQQPAASAASNGFARNLAGQIRGVSFTEGTTRIELTPQGLGKMEIEIAADEAGKLRVVVRAENPAVLNAMRNDRDMLAGLLRDGGASVEDGAMSFEDLGQRRQTAGQEAPGGTLATASVAVDDEDDAAIAAPVVEDGRLNILT